MSLTMTILMLVCGWLAVAGAMLWGILRIARRHQHPVQSISVAKADQPAARSATAH